MDWDFIISLLGDHPVYNFSMLLLTLSGPVYAVCSDIVGKRKKSPTYWIGTTQLLRESFDSKTKNKIKITYDNIEIPNVSITSLVFWNRGKDAIRKTDIPSKNPLKVHISSQYKILDAYIQKQSSPDNNFVLKKNRNDNSVEISFEYIEHNQGGVIKIVHDAPDSKAIKVTGKVISGDQLQRKGQYTSNVFTKAFVKFLLLTSMVSLRERTVIIRWTFIGFGSMLISLPLLISFFEHNADNTITIPTSLLFPVLGIFYVVMGLSQKNYIPKNLME